MKDCRLSTYPFVPNNVEGRQNDKIILATSSDWTTNLFPVDHRWQSQKFSLYATVLGTAVFASSLSISTLTQLRLFGISTGTPPPIPSLVGIASVAVASITSHVVSVKAYQAMKMGDYSLSQPISLDLTDGKTLAHALRVCILGMLAFKGLGGRFWSIPPSSYTNLGSFARTKLSLPATDAYASSAQRRSIERMGRLIGCHVCGSRELFSRSKVKFHADHMPPRAVARQMNSRWFRRLFRITVSQRFYPQCTNCSSKQGGILAAATAPSKQRQLKSLLFRNKERVAVGSNLARAGGGKLAHFHGCRFRMAHFAGGVVAAVTVSDANEVDVLGKGGGNRQRYRKLQEWIEDCFSSARQIVNDLL